MDSRAHKRLVIVMVEHSDEVDEFYRMKWARRLRVTRGFGAAKEEAAQQEVNLVPNYVKNLGYR